MLFKALRVIFLAISFRNLIAGSPIDRLTHEVKTRQPAALLPIQHYENENSRSLHMHSPRAMLDNIPPPQRSTGENGYIGAIYMCTNYGYQGLCSYAQYDMATCYNLTPPFANNVSSFSPDQYTGAETFKFECRIWDGKGCTGMKEWPGTNNLWFDAASLDNNGRSVKCNFMDPDGQCTYDEWKKQGYDFDRNIERERPCESFCA